MLVGRLARKCGGTHPKYGLCHISRNSARPWALVGRLARKCGGTHPKYGLCRISRNSAGLWALVGRSQPSHGSIVGAFCERPRTTNGRPYRFYRGWGGGVGDDAHIVPLRFASTSSVAYVDSFPSRGSLTRLVRRCRGRRPRRPVNYPSVKCFAFASSPTFARGEVEQGEPRRDRAPYR